MCLSGASNTPHRRYKSLWTPCTIERKAAIGTIWPWSDFAQMEQQDAATLQILIASRLSHSQSHMHLGQGSERRSKENHDRSKNNADVRGSSIGQGRWSSCRNLCLDSATNI